MRKSFIFSFFLVFLILFFIPSNFALTVNYTNSYNYVGYSSRNKQDVLIPIGREGNVTFNDYYIGEIPLFLNSIIFPSTSIKISEGNTNFGNEKCLEIIDNSSTNYCSINVLLNAYKHSNMQIEFPIQVFNQSIANDRGVFKIEIGNSTLILIRLYIEYDYSDNYILFRNGLGTTLYYINMLYNTNMTNVIINYNTNIGKYSLIVIDSYNSTNTFVANNLNCRYGSFPFLSQSYFKVETYSADVFYPRILLYGIDFSASNNYISSQIFQSGFITKNGYVVFKSIQIPILNQISGIDDLDTYTITLGLMTFYNFGKFDYTWCYIYSNVTQLLISDKNYTLNSYDKLQYYLTVDFYSFNYLERVNIPFIINTYLGFSYTIVILPPTFFDLALTFLIPFSILITLSFFTYWITKGKSFIFWTTLFITNLILLIYYNLVLNMGSVLSIAAFFLLLFMKFKDED